MTHGWLGTPLSRAPMGHPERRQWRAVNLVVDPLLPLHISVTLLPYEHLIAFYADGEPVHVAVPVGRTVLARVRGGVQFATFRPLSDRVR